MYTHTHTHTLTVYHSVEFERTFGRYLSITRAVAFFSLQHVQLSIVLAWNRILFAETEAMESSLCFVLYMAAEFCCTIASLKIVLAPVSGDIVLLQRLV